LFVGPITAQDIIDNTPPDGITIKELLARCKVNTTFDNATFIEMVKANLVYGPDKKLKRRPGAIASVT
jgi:hypothetical protein